MPIRSTLTKRGRSILKSHRIAIRPKPFKRKPPPEPVPFNLLGMSSWERKVYQWLKKRAIPFTTQVSYEGGVGVLGGMRVDFVLLDRSTVVRIQGPWHEMPGARARDEMQRLYLLGRGFTVIDLWERDLFDLDKTMPALLGVPVRLPRR